MEGNKEVGITQMVRVNSSTCSLSETIKSIPDEMLFEILLRLSAEDIYHAARLVCRQWYHMTRTHNFIHTHLHHATYGLLFLDEHLDNVFFYVRECEIETYKVMSSKLGFSMSPSCNGLVLENKMHDKVYVISILATDQSFRLPPYPRHMISPFFMGVGYVATSMTYKVFANHDTLRGEPSEYGILTMGVDKSWRFISTHHLSPAAKGALLRPPLINEGVMHWRMDITQVVTLNVDTEIITETLPLIPTVVKLKCRDIFYFSTGRYLSLMISRGELVWEVWEMKPETGEWRKLPNICLKGEKGKMEGHGLKQGDRIEPCGWVKYLEVLVLRIVGDYSNRRFACFYNLVKREISSEKIITSCSYKFLHHKNSLVSPVGWMQS